MSSRIAVAPQRVLAIFLTTAFVVALLAACATAQNAYQPRDEIFGGYSYLNAHGTADFGTKLLTLTRDLTYRTPFTSPGRVKPAILGS